MSTALDVQHLTKHFTAGGTRLFARGAKLHAVDDVSFTLRPGTITALVGESGSGKSTVARMLARLYDPTSGAVLYEGADATQGDPAQGDPPLPLAGADDLPGSVRLAESGEDDRAPHRAAAEDPSASCRRAPSRTGCTSCSRPSASCPPDKYAAKYPHELSGGQRQRVAIARALAVEPRVILADEPTSMLDVSIRIGILNLMLALKEERDLAFLYVTHDLASARYVADEMLVMYAGQIVEQGPIEAVLQNPLHPYTRLLLSAVPESACRRAARERRGPPLAVRGRRSGRRLSLRRALPARDLRSARSAHPSSSRPVDPRARAVT